ncbi:hypothetical protein DUNSADRAFT_14381 [Dunaliella salina]|uniref:Encoded protein n=1 Tax=Dunaliella salina TaxID=3046 RepID=A0ABQ7G7F1_DUNSA|nr:hypothetical protein DUNSADRAFT_14381 [Dunaliella salina]|eukprot:KAF5830530.1 hypothetical protein DUNSADRAFT_14381 [Dunaliella salina]
MVHATCKQRRLCVQPKRGPGNLTRNALLPDPLPACTCARRDACLPVSKNFNSQYCYVRHGACLPCQACTCARRDACLPVSKNFNKSILLCQAWCLFAMPSMHLCQARCLPAIVKARVLVDNLYGMMLVCHAKHAHVPGVMLVCPCGRTSTYVDNLYINRCLQGNKYLARRIAYSHHLWAIQYMCFVRKSSGSGHRGA